MINNDWNRGVTGRWRELLYEIHGYGIPRLPGDWKLLEKSIGFVAHRFGTGTNGAQFAVVLDIDWKSRPIVLHTDLMKGLHLTEMTCKGMVMLLRYPWLYIYPISTSILTLISSYFYLDIYSQTTVVIQLSEFYSLYYSAICFRLSFSVSSRTLK